MKRLLLAALLTVGAHAFAQYNEIAGHNAPRPALVPIKINDGKGGEKDAVVERPVQRDSWGNAANSNHDLAVDGAFDGQTIVVIQNYTGTDHGVTFDFAAPRNALGQKGFSVFRWTNGVPDPKVLAEKLKKANQLWIIGGHGRLLQPAHAEVIKHFFDAGHGVYLWGDNAPYSEDANLVAKALFGVQLVDLGSQGEQVIDVHHGVGSAPGVIEDHLLTTGIEHLYEGHTISTLPELGPLKPLIYGSDGKVVGAYFDQGGKRAIIDGGFTRLYLKWDTAGTGRYVKNAAAWLANAERFGSEVLAQKKQ